MYRKMTSPKRRSSLEEPWHRELMTSTATRTGAIAFRAPTNRSPKIPMKDA